MKYKCLQSFYMVKVGDAYLDFPLDAVKKFNTQTIYSTEELRGLELCSHFAQVPIMFTAIDNMIVGARSQGQEHTVDVLSKFRSNISNMSHDDILTVVLKKHIARLRHAMTVLNSDCPEHGIVWGNADIFEELEREIERCKSE